ncbi:MAG TPA: MerR family transcriptional regulator [Jiangellaceae bacterium]|jgi:DNA-binding transcriptional MerR regulator|nr:MerR family transcriptional regulator [Jiangellaceae bacterium]
MTGPQRSSDHGVYSISVAAELTGIEPHTLRAYERAGLLTPTRSDGGVRRYSDDDLVRLQRINTLAEAGLNFAGIRHVLDLEAENSQLRADFARLRGVDTED